MKNAYKNTQVPISRSQESIRKLLIGFNVRGVQFSEDFIDEKINVRFAKEVEHSVRTISVSMTIPDPPPSTSMLLRIILLRLATNLFMPFLTVNLFLYLYILNEINLILCLTI